MGALAKKINSRQPWSPALVSVSIVIVVFVAVLALRYRGHLQFLEFRAYDLFVSRQAKSPDSEPIALIEITEADIQSPALDYPVWDDKLAGLLGVLEAHQPCVIGVDIFRDMPVPKDGSGLQELNQVLTNHENIVMAYKLGRVDPPPILKQHPDRIGFVDLPVDADVDKKIRRALLYAGETGVSFSMQLALHYLAARGIQPGPGGTYPGSMRLGKTDFRPFEKNDGAYVGADDAGFQILLDFRCPQRFARYTFRDALAGRVPPEALRGKIVLVGVTAESVKDELPTPIRFDLRGIEMQAQIVHQLLRWALQGDRPIIFWKDWQEDAWILVWCLTGGAIGFRARSPWRFVLLIVVALVGLGVIAWEAFQAGLWIPVVAPAVACLPAAALVTSYISYHEKAQRGRLMKLFATQVSPDIAEALWGQRDEFLDGNRPRPQKLPATVLFTDMRTFTSATEGLEPGRLVDWLNEYMEAMAGAVMDNQGVIEKFMGDSLMAVFGVPVARTTGEQIRDDAIRAVRCALAMKRELDRLNAQVPESGCPLYGMRIGIHSGAVVAGSLGSAERMEYTVLGDTVNTASRLESFDKDLLAEQSCRILISETTSALVNGLFETRRIGEISLKGKAERIIIHTVVGEFNSQGGQAS